MLSMILIDSNNYAYRVLIFPKVRVNGSNTVGGEICITPVFLFKTSLNFTIMEFMIIFQIWFQNRRARTRRKDNDSTVFQRMSNVTPVLPYGYLPGTHITTFRKPGLLYWIPMDAECNNPKQ